MFVFVFFAKWYLPYIASLTDLNGICCGHDHHYKSVWIPSFQLVSSVNSHVSVDHRAVIKYSHHMCNMEPGTMYAMIVQCMPDVIAIFAAANRRCIR